MGSSVLSVGSRVPLVAVLNVDLARVAEHAVVGVELRAEVRVARMDGDVAGPVFGKHHLSTGPTSVTTVSARGPLRVLPSAAFSCLSCPRWSVVSPSRADSRILFV